MASNKPVTDFEFTKRDYRRRKNLILFLGSIVDQFLFEAEKLAPAAVKFSKMSDDEKRRWSESVTAISVWLENMKDLAYGDGEEESEPTERIDRNEFGD